MDSSSASRATISRTLEVEGASLVYDVHGELDADTGHPVLVLAGSPMEAYGFGTLVSHLRDRTVVTYDPRGCGRSRRTDGAGPITPELHAADLAQLLDHLGAGPVDLLGGSGGAVNALALVTARPDRVRTVVAHEPPVVTVLPDRAPALAAVGAVHASYLSDGLGAAMARFIALTMHEGLLPDDYAERPGPDPSTFGLPREDDGSRDDPLVGQNIVGCCGYEPDVEVLVGTPSRLVLAVGESSGETIAARAARALAERLGRPVVSFPGDHGGYLGEEYGMPGRPAEFAARLREVLSW